MANETVGCFTSAVTYHLGMLAIVQALGELEQAQDFWQAYTVLCSPVQVGGDPDTLGWVNAVLALTLIHQPIVERNIW